MRNDSARHKTDSKGPALTSRDPASSLRALFVPIDYLLADGGDARLQLSPIVRLNGYGCRPSPRPEAFTFASSTATSISERAYARARNARDELIEASLTRGLDDAFDARVEQMRGELKTHLRLDRSTEIVFSPSGTDSQLHALFIARSLLGAPLTSVIAASDQTGSGTAYTARGLHFSGRTARGEAVEKGAPVAGLATDVTSIEVALHDESGALRSPDVFDRMIIAAVSMAVGEGGKVLLQTMDSSKLGRRCPSSACVEEISARWPDSVQVIVDACQMRLGRARINHYLNCGHMILLTGSKFFTGPPFSGALLVPAQLSARLAGIGAAPPGLCQYTNRSDWPVNGLAARSQLPAHLNFGQWLRWEAALEEMRAYYAVPAAYRRYALTRFAEAVTQILAASPNLELLPPMPPEARDDIDDGEMALRTIFPFAVRRNGDLLQFDDCAKLYRALNGDVSHLLAETARAREKGLAAQLCHIGQPVALCHDGIATAALRISAGARVVSETWPVNASAAQSNLKHELDQVSTICRKLEFLIENLEKLD